MALSMGQYEALISPPPTLPSQKEIFWEQVETWNRIGPWFRMELEPLEGLVPDAGLFLVVPDLKGKVSPAILADLMKFVKVGERVGSTRLSPEGSFTDVEKVPDGPYLGLDVEDGRENVTFGRSLAEKLIRAQGRTPYTILEVVVHAIAFSMVLSKRYLYSTGSSFMIPGGASGYIPGIGMLGATPELSFHPRFGPYPDGPWGAPSFGSRRGLAG